MARCGAVTTIDDERWAAVVRRDSAAIGRFVYAVRSTGIYCHPSCPSRRPNPINVRFFETPKLAQAAGFRACKRCRPNRTTSINEAAEALIRACRFIEESETAPSLSEIAKHVGFSPFHLHRVFQKRLGITPKQYAAARRTERLKLRLSLGEPVTDAIYGAGFGTSGRCYAQASGILGMTPKQYADQGRNASIRFAVAPCRLGQVLVAVTASGICHIALGDRAASLKAGLLGRFPAAEQIEPDKQLRAALTAVVSLIESPTEAREFPLDIRGAAFQQKVWLVLRAIPPGKTLTYSERATAIGRPSAVRTVAAACAANSLAVATPCHRAVRADGGLGGYRWETKRKKALLEREHQPPSEAD